MPEFTSLPKMLTQDFWSLSGISSKLQKKQKPYDGESYSDTTDYPTWSYLTINAVDGSIIDSAAWATDMKQVFGIVRYNFFGFFRNPKVIFTFLLEFVLSFLLTGRIMIVMETYDTPVQAIEPFLWDLRRWDCGAFKLPAFAPFVAQTCPK